MVKMKELCDMKECIVRIQRIEIRNLKNVGKGSIQFACNMKNDIFENKSDLLGVYGQNGSGKTTLIYAISLFKSLATGTKLGKDCENYIKYGLSNAMCKFEFSIIDENNQYYRVIYEFELRRNENELGHFNVFEVNEDQLKEDKENEIYISKEKISLSKFVNGKWTKLTPILSFEENNDNILLPQNRLLQLIQGDKNIEDELRVVKLLKKKSSKSFLFSEELNSIIRNSKIEDEYKNVFNILNYYAVFNLQVISNADNDKTNSYIALPIFKEKEVLIKVILSINGITKIPTMIYETIYKKIELINLVLKEIIPGLTIRLKKVGTTIAKDEEEIVFTQLMATRGNATIPLKYESDGIKKLITILYGLIMVFNNRSATLAVDEFDSGIFEYLLGEILNVIEENGKGQLIFTSHNLRPLEVINKKNIMFTTTNENNRYIRFKNVKANNNLRDLLFHDIILGGQNECIYEMTNPYLIRRAFRLAGDEDGE